MKIKKIAVINIWLALNAFLFASCQELPDNNLPDGIGSLSLSFFSNTARTIIPETPAIASFANFQLIFIPVVNGEAHNETQINAGAALQPVILTAGTYNLVVNALNTAGDVIARGTETGIVINSGQNTNVTVTLFAMLGESNNDGYFSWNISINSSPIIADSAEMIIRNLSGVQQGSAVSLNTTGISSGIRTLASGIYTITVNLKQTNNSLVQWYELLHIYECLTSNFTHSFNSSHFNRSHYTVAYNYNYEPAPNTITQSILHGDTIANNGGLYSPSRTGYTFDNWYKESALTNLYNPNEQIIDDITFYAKWTAITYTVVYNVNAASGAGGAAITGSTANTTHTYDVPQNLRANGFTRPGYKFSGWNTAANGSGTAYTDEQEVNNLRALSETVTLYAQWTENTITITLTAQPINDPFDGVSGPQLTLSRFGNNGPQMGWVVINNMPSYQSVEWWVGSMSTPRASGTSLPIFIDSSLIAAGGYQIVIRAMIGGMLYQLSGFLTVTN